MCGGVRGLGGRKCGLAGEGEGRGHEPALLRALLFALPRHIGRACPRLPPRCESASPRQLHPPRRRAPLRRGRRGGGRLRKRRGGSSRARGSVALPRGCPRRTPQDSSRRCRRRTQRTADCSLRSAAGKRRAGRPREPRGGGGAAAPHSGSRRRHRECAAARSGWAVASVGVGSFRGEGAGCLRAAALLDWRRRQRVDPCLGTGRRRAKCSRFEAWTYLPRGRASDEGASAALVHTGSHGIRKGRVHLRPARGQLQRRRPRHRCHGRTDGGGPQGAPLRRQRRGALLATA
ncbi:hypothetical protein T492DRAFT_991305 [Pavlovales sp. CCMP2436]|nr:hypothetical protein T492DRAFT_991305 [Pavlovales sp. CCMP2436]